MAGVSVPPAEVLLSKRVQQMVIAGDEPLGPYLCRNDHHDEEYTATSPIPAVDIGCFATGNWSAEETEEELQKLKSSLSTWGCFQAMGHGIPTSLLDEVRQLGREFFEQPMEEKSKYSKTVNEFQGYGADPVPEEGQSLDWSDRFFLELVPEERRDYRLWPQQPTCFKWCFISSFVFKWRMLHLRFSSLMNYLCRKMLEEYTEQMKRVTEIVSKSMARSLGLDENCFLAQFGEGAQLAIRFNYYSPCTRPDLMLGLKPHADGSGYTIILQDEVGLQIRKDGKWHTVFKNPDALLVLMGDQMEIMSNGEFKSPVHRANSPVHRVVSDEKRERISVAMFYTPEVGKEIGPEEGLISGEAPRLFKKVKDYADIHWGYYQKGMRALHAAQL